MLQFDEKGHLMPYQIIELTLSEFEYHFVDGLEDKAHRRRLFENYLRYLEQLSSLLRIPFYQFANGSFTTLKEQPNDIDVVSFIEYEVMKRALPGLVQLKTEAKKSLNVDGHYSYLTKWNHRLFENSQENYQFWLNLFGSGREDEHGISHPKGIIKITFNK